MTDKKTVTLFAKRIPHERNPGVDLFGTKKQIKFNNSINLLCLETWCRFFGKLDGRKIYRVTITVEEEFNER